MPPRDSIRKGAPSLRRQLARAALLVLLVGVPAAIATRWLVSPGESFSLRDRLAVAGLSPAAIREALPERLRPNDAVLRIEAIALRIGIDLRPEPRRRGSGSHPEHAIARATWLQGELAKPDASPGLPPQALMDQLLAQRSDLELLRHELLTSRPRWESFEGFQTHGRPGEVLKLARMFVVLALVEAGSGGPTSAAQSLQAARALEVSLRTSRHPVSHLVAGKIAVEIQAAARKIDLPPTWIGAFDPDAARRGMALACAAEAHRLFETSQGGLREELLMEIPDEGPSSHLMRAVPLLSRHAVSGLGDRMAFDALLLADAGFEHGLVGSHPASPHSGILAGFFGAPRSIGFARRVAMNELHREMTEYVLAVREDVAAGRAPRPHHGSSIPQVTWDVTVSHSGTSVSLRPATDAWWKDLAMHYPGTSWTIPQVPPSPPR